MASSNKEDDKLISVYDSSSSSQPFLQKVASQPIASYPRIDESIVPSINQVDDSETSYLQISYNHGQRRWKDIFFLFLFLLFVLMTFGFGVFAIAKSNPSYFNLPSYKYDYSSSKCVKKVGSPLVYVSMIRSSFVDSNSSRDFVRISIWVVVITLMLSMPICFLTLLCLKRYTKHIVYTCIPLFVIFLIFFNVYWFVACTVRPTCSSEFQLLYRIITLIFVFAVIGLMVWAISANWHRVELTVQMIEISSSALSKNLGLFIALPLMILGLVAYCSPIVLFLVFAKRNGKILPIVSDRKYSCAWKQDGWVSAYFALAIISMLWSLSSMFEAQVYVISGSVAQWYFSKEDLIPKRNIRSSLRNAFGPSAGTICASGLLIWAVRVVRSLVDSARDEAPGMVNRALRCCVITCLSAVEFANKFTIMFAAIAGEGYCSSGRMTYELLRRNLLSTAVVEIISTRLLAAIVFVIAAIYSVATCAVVTAVTELGGRCYVLSLAAFALLYVIMGYFFYVLDKVIEAVYICYAIDRDRGEVFKPDVHDVYVQLPIRRKHVAPLV